MKMVDNAQFELQKQRTSGLRGGAHGARALLGVWVVAMGMMRWWLWCDGGGAQCGGWLVARGGAILGWFGMVERGIGGMGTQRSRDDELVQWFEDDGDEATRCGRDGRDEMASRWMGVEGIKWLD